MTCTESIIYILVPCNFTSGIPACVVGGLGVWLNFRVSRFQTKERRHAEAVSAALERRRIAKKKAAAMVVKRERAAVSIALNEEKQAKQKVRHDSININSINGNSFVGLLPSPAMSLCFLLFIFSLHVSFGENSFDNDGVLILLRTLCDSPYPSEPLLFPYVAVSSSISPCQRFAFGLSVLFRCVHRLSMSRGLSCRAPLQATYETGFREAARIFHEREQRKVGAHFTLISFSITCSKC